MDFVGLATEERTGLIAGRVVFSRGDCRRDAGTLIFGRGEHNDDEKICLGPMHSYSRFRREATHSQLRPFRRLLGGGGFSFAC